MNLSNRARKGLVILGLSGILSGFGISYYAQSKKCGLLEENQKKLQLAKKLENKLEEISKDVREFDICLEKMKKEKGVNLFDSEEFIWAYGKIREEYKTLQNNSSKAIENLKIKKIVSDIKTYETYQEAGEILTIGSLISSFLLIKEKKNQGERLKELIDEIYRRKD